MPVLPDVGSISTVLPGVILPSASSTSIIDTPMRSLTDDSGLKNSSFIRMSAFAPACLAIFLRAHERRMADRLGDVVVDPAAAPGLGRAARS